MKKDTINYFMVGSFVLAMLILLLYGLYRITGQTIGAVEYYVLLDNVQEVKPGTAVTYGGFPVGQVSGFKALRKQGKTRYQLTLDIRSDWEIPDNSFAQIVKPGLISDSLLEITEGDAKDILEPGGYIQGRESVDVMRLMTSIGNQLNDFVPQVTADVRDLLNKLNRSADQISQILSNKNRAHIENLFVNIDQSSQSIARMTEGFDKVNQQLNQLLQQSSALIGDNDKDIRLAVVELRRTMLNISSSMDEILYNLSSSSRNMNEFSRQLRDNPGVLLGSKPPVDAAEAH